MRSIKETALAFHRACVAAEVPYALVGGFAVMAWGQPRATMDVDALTRLEEKRVVGFQVACRSERLQFSLEDAKDALRAEGRLSIMDLDSPYHVDVKIARALEEVQQVESAVDVKFEEGHLRVAAPEDTVAYKLLFGSPQDLADARSVIVRQREGLEWSLLRARCARLRVVKKLDALLLELGIEEGPDRRRK